MVDKDDNEPSQYEGHAFTVSVSIQSTTDMLMTIQGDEGAPAVVSLGMTEEAARSMAHVLLQGADHLRRLKEAPSGALN